MSVYLIERISAYLASNGPCTTPQLATALSETTTRVADALKSVATQGRWGIQRGYMEGYRGKGPTPNLWSIDTFKYKRYLQQRRPMPWIEKRVAQMPPKVPKPKPPKPKAPKAVTVKTPKADYTRKPFVYTGPIRTVWQPSSPYFKGAANEHAGS